MTPPFSSPGPRAFRQALPKIRVFGDQNSIKIWIRLGSRLRPKKWPTWVQLGPQDGAQVGQKSWKNRCKNWSKNRCLSRSIFDAILMDFGRENGGKLALKSEPKSILALKRKNQLNASPLVPNWVRRVQVGSKKRSKIDQNLKSKMDCLLASIFGGFWWVLGGKLGWKIEPRASKNQLKSASKKWWKKHAFWCSRGGG